MTNPILRRTEGILDTQLEQLRLLRDRLPIASPQSLPPQVYVSVETPDIAQTITPALEGLGDLQAQTLEEMGSLREQGKTALAQGRASLREEREQTNLLGTISEQGDTAIEQRTVTLRESRIQTGLLGALMRDGEYALTQRMAALQEAGIQRLILASLDAQGRQAYVQRNLMLVGVAGLGVAAHRIGEGVDDLCVGVQMVHHDLSSLGVDLHGLRDSAHDTLMESRTHTATLASIANAAHGHTSLLTLLTHLDTDALEQLRTQSRMFQDVLSEMDVAYRQREAAYHQREAALATLQGIHAGISVAIQELHAIAERLRTPARVAAFEKWEIGERCRTVGSPLDALRMYENSLQDNPAEPRNYFSLGLEFLSVGDVLTARDCFYTAATLASDEPKIRSIALGHLAKLAMVERQHMQALLHLEEILSITPDNLEARYDAMICTIELGDQDKAQTFFDKLYRDASPALKERLEQKEIFQPLYLAYLQRTSTEKAEEAERQRIEQEKYNLQTSTFTVTAALQERITHMDMLVFQHDLSFLDKKMKTAELENMARHYLAILAQRIGCQFYRTSYPQDPRVLEKLLWDDAFLTEIREHIEQHDTEQGIPQKAVTQRASLLISPCNEHAQSVSELNRFFSAIAAYRRSIIEAIQRFQIPFFDIADPETKSIVQAYTQHISGTDPELDAVRLRYDRSLRELEHSYHAVLVCLQQLLSTLRFSGDDSFFGMLLEDQETRAKRLDRQRTKENHTYSICQRVEERYESLKAFRHQHQDAKSFRHTPSRFPPLEPMALPEKQAARKNDTLVDNFLVWLERNITGHRCAPMNPHHQKALPILDIPHAEIRALYEELIEIFSVLTRHLDELKAYVGDHFQHGDFIFYDSSDTEFFKLLKARDEFLQQHGGRDALVARYTTILCTIATYNAKHLQQ